MGGADSLALIAETGARFSDFRPYVAAVADDGTVAFQAALAGGGQGIFTGAGGEVTAVCETATSPLRACTSHPAINAAGDVSWYAELDDGRGAVVAARAGALRTIADGRIGPLGPTMNAAGIVAYRADGADGVARVLVGDGDATTVVAEARGAFAGFDGLPVVTDGGAVVFRAMLADGRHGIYRWAAGATTAVAETGAPFAELGRFPCAGAEDEVVFAARRTSGEPGVFAWRGGELTTAVDGAAFDSIRGALATARGDLIYFATPPGGTLGIYCHGERLLGHGEPLLGSTIDGFVLNPVSINARAQLALRVELAGGRQVIARLSC